jgi:hypothetical protein
MTVEFPKGKAIHICVEKNVDTPLAYARVLLGPYLTSSDVVANFAFAGQKLPDDYSAMAVIESLKKDAAKINAGDMTGVEAVLSTQATALNAMFSALASRAASNMGEYVETSERYLRMALKAQNQCRMTLETLSNIKNPPVIYAKQANIANGPQQVNNTLHAHAGENKNQPIKVLEESHEQRVDSPAQGKASGSNSELATVDASHRA